MKDLKQNKVYRIDPSVPAWRFVIALVFLIAFIITGWKFVLFMAGLFSGMALIMKVWSLEFDLILVPRGKGDSPDTDGN